MTPEQRAAARMRCKAASPAPWRWDDAAYLCSEGIVDANGETVIANSGRGGSDFTDDDRDFVCNASTDLPAALDSLDARDALLREIWNHLIVLERKLADQRVKHWLDCDELMAKIKAILTQEK